MVLRDLPGVDTLAAAVAVPGLPRALIVEVARRAVEEARRSRLEGGEADPYATARAELEGLALLRPTRVVNATGVLLHTNLGRAPLPPAAAAAAGQAATGYGNLEIDLRDGERGGRGEYVRRLLATITGGEDALAVNNCAGGLFLTLAALAAGRKVLVSRGELVEIGGSFRLPTLMAAAGVWLVEVGTTNRTRLDDYAEAVASDTALVLKVHASNYRMVGFAEEAGYADLAALARSRGLPFVADLGSGLIDAEVPWLPGAPPGWLAGEPGVRQTLAAGADLALFSGDKLLGGPQAGLVVGRAGLIARLRRHPVARAVRCDGPTLAALAVTLEMYADGRAGDIPFWAAASLPAETLAARAAGVLAGSGVDGAVHDDASVPGAGAVPGRTIPSPVIVVPGGQAAWRGLVGENPPVVARRREGDLVVDLRAVDPADDAHVAAALRRACRS